jgi:hypothetical protein
MTRYELARGSSGSISVQTEAVRSTPILGVGQFANAEIMWLMNMVRECRRRSDYYSPKSWLPSCWAIVIGGPSGGQ